MQWCFDAQSQCLWIGIRCGTLGLAIVSPILPPSGIHIAVLWEDLVGGYAGPNHHLRGLNDGASSVLCHVCERHTVNIVYTYYIYEICSTMSSGKNQSKKVNSYRNVVPAKAPVLPHSATLVRGFQRIGGAVGRRLAKAARLRRGGRPPSGSDDHGTTDDRSVILTADQTSVWAHHTSLEIRGVLDPTPSTVAVDRPRSDISVPECADGEHFFVDYYCERCNKYCDAGKTVRDGPNHTSCRRLTAGLECQSPAVTNGERPSSSTGSVQPDDFFDALESSVACVLPGSLRQDEDLRPTHNRLRSAACGRDVPSSEFDYAMALSRRKRRREARMNYLARLGRPEEAAAWRVQQSHAGAAIRAARAQKLEGRLKRNAQSNFISNRTDGSDYGLSCRTTAGIAALFDDGAPYYASARAAAQPAKPRHDFSEKRGILAPVAELFGYSYDHFDFGTRPVYLRGLKAEDVAQNEHIDETEIARRIDPALADYLFSEKMPPSEYLDKQGNFDRDLVLVHMHKLTKQYYASRELPRTSVSRQKDVATQSYVASETLKSFLLLDHSTTAPKVPNFYRACYRHRRKLAAGVMLGGVVFGLYQCRHAAATAKSSAQLLAGSMLSSTTPAAMGSVLRAQCCRFSTRLLSAALNLM